MFRKRWLKTDGYLSRVYPVDEKEYMFLEYINSLVCSHGTWLIFLSHSIVHKNLKTAVSYGLPDLFWRRPIRRYRVNDTFSQLRVLLAPYTTTPKELSQIGLLGSYRIFFNSQAFPLVDRDLGTTYPRKEVVGSILQHFQHHSVRNRLAKQFLEYAPKADAPWNDGKFAGKRYVGLYCMENDVTH